MIAIGLMDPAEDQKPGGGVFLLAVCRLIIHRPALAGGDGSVARGCSRIIAYVYIPYPYRIVNG
jgi:hypothetical protein